MTGIEHYYAAEASLQDIRDGRLSDLSEADLDREIAIAQVHATLALTAVTYHDGHYFYEGFA